MSNDNRSNNDGGPGVPINELIIPSIYGNIAAKTWGEPKRDRLKMLAIHGWQDNAGTFDRLFPLLTKDSLYIVALDLPGHGYSNHLPKGVPYTDLTWVLAIKKVLDYFKWNNGVHLIAHSMGAHAALQVAALFPDTIESLIMLDTIKPKIYRNDELATEMAANVSSFLVSQSYFNRSIRTLIKVKRAISLIIGFHQNGKLDPTSARILLRRSSEYVPPGKLLFKRDPRLNYIINRRFDKEHLMAYLSNISCKLLIIRAINTHPSLRCSTDDEFLEFFQQKCREFKYQEVNGDHYVHLTNPNEVVPAINEFLAPMIEVAKSTSDTRFFEYFERIGQNRYHVIFN